MRRLPFLLLLAGCPSPNPSQLWLAENGSEAMVKLSDQGPVPF
jgi:hypothetical protein